MSHNLEVIAMLVQVLNRNHLPQLFSLQAHVNAGKALSSDDVAFLLDCIETAHATITLTSRDQAPSDLAHHILSLCDSISMKALLNDQRSRSTRYRTPTNPTQTQEVTP